MPELPEVETVKRGLERLIIGRTIIAERHNWPKGFPNSKSDVNTFLIGSQVQSVSRRGKALIIALNTGYSLLIHLKMTGQLVFVPAERMDLGSEILDLGGLQRQDLGSESLDLGGAAKTGSRKGMYGVRSTEYEVEKTGDLGSESLDLGGAAEARQSKIPDPRSQIYTHGEARFGAGHPNESLIGNLPDKSTRVTFTFADGSHLYFNDQRKFGWVKLLPNHAIEHDSFIRKLGPEPLEKSFTNTKFVQRINRRQNSTIKAALLDQSVIAGVGNIYADEALWAARIHPTTRVKSVKGRTLHTLFDELVAVLLLSIEKGGSTDKNYVTAEGKKGSYISFAKVFRREGQPCTRCGAVIEKTRVAGRGTHVCPTCQPEI